MGELGETDVIAYADMGSAGYTAIIDAKARKARVLNNLEPQTLHKHQQRHQADYVVVVSEGFYNPIVRVAQANDIVLITLSTLAAWLKLHQYSPRSMETYRAFFQRPGWIASVPDLVSHAPKRILSGRSLIAQLMARPISGG